MVSFVGGVILYLFFRILLLGLNTVAPDERAVITSFGRAKRAAASGEAPELTDEEKQRYQYPRLLVKGPGTYLLLPWWKLHKVKVATEAVDLVWDPTKAQSSIEAVTKDNLTTGVNGQLRYRVSEQNLYPYLFGVESPLQHVMGYFISVMRERVANFVDPKGASLIPEQSAQGHESTTDFEGVSINDLRKNLPLLNRYMEEQCSSTVGRYGIELDAALITEIDPPSEVDHALSAINSTRNQVAADLSTARADAEQQITMSKRAVEIAQNNAEAEVAPLRELATTLKEIKQAGGSQALAAYVRNMKIPLLKRTVRLIEKR
jgi:regulator of protease activity HflC (stomatin/prohibitin superfamily)